MTSWVTTQRGTRQVVAPANPPLTPVPSPAPPSPPPTNPFPLHHPPPCLLQGVGSRRESCHGSGFGVTGDRRPVPEVVKVCVEGRDGSREEEEFDGEGAEWVPPLFSYELGLYQPGLQMPVQFLNATDEWQY